MKNIFIFLFCILALIFCNKKETKKFKEGSEKAELKKAYELICELANKTRQPANFIFNPSTGGKYEVNFYKDFILIKTEGNVRGHSEYALYKDGKITAMIVTYFRGTTLYSPIDGDYPKHLFVELLKFLAKKLEVEPQPSDQNYRNVGYRSIERYPIFVVHYTTDSYSLDKLGLYLYIPKEMYL